MFATLEPPGSRYLTLNGQQFSPGARGRPLFPMVFFRSCGQEYHPVWIKTADRQPTQVEPRELNEKTAEDEGLVHGYFMPDPAGSFEGGNLDLYPDE